ncbi:S8 family serine peptidase [Lactobacillaceae bacterium L1_55_11]|nr:S8 family serine peptidase [Lactobacillaceae bacterium L1_55_11]
MTNQFQTFTNQFSSIEMKNHPRYRTAATLAALTGGIIMGSHIQAAADTVTTTSSASSTSQSQTASTSPASTATSTSATASSTSAASTSTQSTANSQGQPANQADLNKINVQQAWQDGYRGQGTVVAVIDTGIDASHPALRLSDPATAAISQSQAQAKIKSLGYGEYLSDKVPFAYNYVANSSTKIVNDADPHGQHVAGTVAANGAGDGQQEYTQGVAPEAQILAMRVADNGNNLDAIVQAAHDAVTLGADVIQISISANYSAQQKENIQQRVVDYANAHGVLVVVSAGNGGNAGSIASDTNPDAGTNQLAYQPLNTGTIGDPGTAAGAITVAAENSQTGSGDQMLDQSSWGPLPDLTLKPDISAPGVSVVSTWNQGQFKTGTGTSMAAPHVAGAGLLVLEHLKTLTDLAVDQRGQVAKLALMNTATVKTDPDYGSYISPRRQGAGGLNAAAAVKTDVVVHSADDQGSQSLHQIGQKTTFTLTLNNYGDQDHQYQVSSLGAPMTDHVDSSHNNQSYDAAIPDAQLTADQDTITIPAHGSRTVTFTLSLPDSAQTGNVEGFLQFKSLDGQPDLSVPYYGYYGDPTSEQVFDTPANQTGSLFGGNYLLDNHNFPLGISDPYSLKSLLNHSENYNWQQLAKLVQDGKVAFSPDSTDPTKVIRPYEFIKENLEDLKVEILDRTGQVVRVISDNRNVAKSSYNADVLGTTNVDLGLNIGDSQLDWDGTLYNPTTGQSYVAPDGQYTYRLVGTLWNQGKAQVQNADYPIVIDTTAPEITQLSYDATKHQVDVSYQDSGSGFTDYSLAKILINNQVITLPLKGTFTDDQRLAGHITYTLTDHDLSELGDATNLISVAVSDVANNTGVKTISTDPVTGHSPVVLYNVIENVPLDQSSDSYNAKTGTYLVQGSSSLKRFYMNNQLVEVDQQGHFTAPISVNSTQLTVQTAANQPALINFNLGYPAPSFAWEKSTVDPTDANQIIVTAQVNAPTDSQTTAFARDIQTNQVYEGSVDGQTGQVTFTLPRPAADGRLSLDGWSKILLDDSTSIHSGLNTVSIPGVNPEANLADDTASQNTANSAWVVQDPALPGRVPSTKASRATSLANSWIYFDNVQPNGLSKFNQSAISQGYYNASTGRFTVTGQVADDVTSLVVLKNSSYPTDPANQVSLDSSHHFSFDFPLDPTQLKGVSYILTNKAGQTKQGMFQVLLDTQLPTLTLGQLSSTGSTSVSGDSLIVNTNQPVLNLNGQIDDNVDGYRLFVNGSNIYTEYKVGGYNAISGVNDQSTGSVNPFPAHEFSEDYPLSQPTNATGPTQQILNVKVVDQLGNQVAKQIIVNYWKRNLTAPTYVINNQTLSVLNPSDMTQYSLDQGQSWDTYQQGLTLAGQEQVLLRNQDQYGNTSDTVTAGQTSNSSSGQQIILPS